VVKTAGCRDIQRRFPPCHENAKEGTDLLARQSKHGVTATMFEAFKALFAGWNVLLDDTKKGRTLLGKWRPLARHAKSETLATEA
jgi:hypothetical protein